MADTLAAYASGKGYQVLSSNAPGEGFWLNAGTFAWSWFFPGTGTGDSGSATATLI